MDDDDLARRGVENRVSDLERDIGFPGGAAEAMLLIRECLVELGRAVEALGGEITSDFDDRLRRIEEIRNMMRLRPAAPGRRAD
jgi:hypothetical protein